MYEALCHTMFALWPDRGRGWWSVDTALGRERQHFWPCCWSPSSQMSGALLSLHLEASWGETFLVYCKRSNKNFNWTKYQGCRLYEYKRGFRAIFFSMGGGGVKSFHVHVKTLFFQDIFFSRYRYMKYKIVTRKQNVTFIYATCV